MNIQETTSLLLAEMKTLSDTLKNATKDSSDMEFRPLGIKETSKLADFSTTETYHRGKADNGYIYDMIVSTKWVRDSITGTVTPTKTITYRGPDNQLQSAKPTGFKFVAIGGASPDENPEIPEEVLLEARFNVANGKYHPSRSGFSTYTPEVGTLTDYAFTVTDNYAGSVQTFATGGPKLFTTVDTSTGIRVQFQINKFNIPESMSESYIDFSTGGLGIRCGKQMDYVYDENWEPIDVVTNMVLIPYKVVIDGSTSYKLREAILLPLSSQHYIIELKLEGKNFEIVKILDDSSNEVMFDEDVNWISIEPTNPISDSIKINHSTYGDVLPLDEKVLRSVKITKLVP